MRRAAGRHSTLRGRNEVKTAMTDTNKTISDERLAALADRVAAFDKRYGAHVIGTEYERGNCDTRAEEIEEACVDLLRELLPACRAPSTAVVTMEMINRLVEAELDAALALCNGGAPSYKIQVEHEAETVAARAALSAALSLPIAQPMNGISIKPLEWRVPTDHPSDPDIEENVYCANGIGGRYAISKKQKVGPERLLWMADDPFVWVGFNSIPEAKAAAQADYEQRILSALEAAAIQPDSDREGESNAARDVLDERARQISAEGRTPDHDDAHRGGSLAAAAACYAVWDAIPDTFYDLHKSARASVTWLWPWGRNWFKPSGHRRNLVKAGALIIAEIERLDRSLKAGGAK